MKFTEQARSLLEKLEGCRCRAYVDQAGVWTIGYGHTGHDVVPGLEWTPSQCELALARDLENFVGGVYRLVCNRALNDNQFSALVIFSFNVGLAAFSASTALRRTLLGAYADVPPAILLWDKIHDPRTGNLMVDPGLVKRRQAEVALWKQLPSEMV